MPPRRPGRPATALVTASVLALVSGCATPPPAANVEPVSTGGGYEAQYRDIPQAGSSAGTASSTVAGAGTLGTSQRLNAASCRPFAGGTNASGRLPSALARETLSPGDLLSLRLHDDATFNGDYVVSRDGTLKLPYIPPVRAQGRTTEAVRAEVLAALEKGGLYDASNPPRLSLLVKDFAPASVAVSGAVYEPHMVEIGGVSSEQRDTLRQNALGSSTRGRDLSVALRAAGGVRPDADLSDVQVIRGGASYRLDLRGAINGHGFEDAMLMTGDRVVVPSRGCFQANLMVPSPITPPGISLFLSNLTVPATGNAASANGREVREVPYGTRFLQAVINANCVGGARATSANRSAALFTRNPETGVSAVIERKVEVLRSRADRDEFDPYLLPGDAIACYDSGITNLFEIGRLIGAFR